MRIEQICIRQQASPLQSQKSEDGQKSLEDDDAMILLNSQGANDETTK
jgi:hypothetical protein